MIRTKVVSITKFKFNKNKVKSVIK